MYALGKEIFCRHGRASTGVESLTTKTMMVMVMRMYAVSFHDAEHVHHRHNHSRGCTHEHLQRRVSKQLLESCRLIHGRQPTGLKQVPNNCVEHLGLLSRVSPHAGSIIHDNEAESETNRKETRAHAIENCHGGCDRTHE